jgi:hypothetical protein
VTIAVDVLSFDPSAFLLGGVRVSESALAR